MNLISKYIMFSALLGTTGLVYAQDSYDAHNFANSDLNGTSRFVAMGGALGALGGDISVMSTNPAGTGLYRRSDASVTFSGVFAGEGARGHDGSRMSLDQGGALIAFDMDNPRGQGLQYVNFGVNYQKKRNYLSNLSTGVQHLDNYFSQTYQIRDMANNAMYDAVYDGENYDRYFGIMTNLATYDDNTVLRDMVNGNGDPVYDELDNQLYDGVPASKAVFERATYGANVQADVNISFNMSDQFFYGLSVGVYNIEYDRESFYEELRQDGTSYNWDSWYKTSGDGFDLKFGFICRPIEDSPFRFGAYIHTPTWYRMTDANGANLYYEKKRVGYLENAEYDYNYRTPWKFGVSLGHTIGTCFAIGAEYEYQDFSTAKYSEIDGNATEYFRYANAVTKETLRGQHTLKVGAEFKPIDAFSIRLGYNFVSSPFKKGAFRTLMYDDPYTETDYTNWGAINRFTAGVGYRFKGGYFDVTYQYQAQKGDFYAFDNVSENGEKFQPTKIDANRSQLMATLGFRF